MLKVIFAEYGTPHPDHASELIAQRWVESALMEGDDVLKVVSTQNVVTALRMLVAEGKAPFELVTLKFGNEDWVTLDRDGIPSSWKGLDDSEQQCLRRMVRARIDRRKAERNDSNDHGDR